MNPVFWFLVILALGGVWVFGCGAYREIGAFIQQNLDNVKNAMKDEKETDEDE